MKGFGSINNHTKSQFRKDVALLLDDIKKKFKSVERYNTHRGLSKDIVNRWNAFMKVRGWEYMKLYVHEPSGKIGVVFDDLKHFSSIVAILPEPERVACEKLISISKELGFARDTETVRYKPTKRTNDTENGISKTQSAFDEFLEKMESFEDALEELNEHILGNYQGLEFNQREGGALKVLKLLWCGMGVISIAAYTSLLIHPAFSVPTLIFLGSPMNPWVLFSEILSVMSLVMVAFSAYAQSSLENEAASYRAKLTEAKKDIDSNFDKIEKYFDYMDVLESCVKEASKERS